MPKNNDPTPRTFMDRLRESKLARGAALLGAGATLATLTACGPSEKEAPAPAPTTATAPVTPGASETTSPSPSETTTTPQPSATETGNLSVEQVEAKRNEVSKAIDIDPAAFKKLPRAEQATLALNYVDWMYVKYTRNPDYASRLGDTTSEGYEVLDTVSSVAADWEDTSKIIDYKRRLMQVAMEEASNNAIVDYSENISDNLRTFFTDRTLDSKINPHFTFKGGEANAVMRCSGVIGKEKLTKYDTQPWEHAWTSEQCTNANLPRTWIAKYVPTSDGRHIWEIVMQ